MPTDEWNMCVSYASRRNPCHAPEYTEAHISAMSVVEHRNLARRDLAISKTGFGPPFFFAGGTPARSSHLGVWKQPSRWSQSNEGSRRAPQIYKRAWSYTDHMRQSEPYWTPDPL